MRAVDLLTVISNSPNKKEYKGIYLTLKDKIQPLTSIQMNEENQCIFVFDQSGQLLSMKEVLLILMKNREKELFYQKDNQNFPLYGLKEGNNQLVI